MDKAEQLARLKRLTPEQRALLLQALKEEGAPRRQTQTITRRPNHSPCRLSFAQERLWFLHQLEPESTTYNEPFGVRLTGRLDAAALERSFNEAVRRHEILRTTVELVDGQPMQVIAPSLPLPLPVVDVRGGSAAEREAAARRLIDEEARRPFDLARGPLIRVLVLRLDEREHLLILSMHHIIMDLWSIGVLLGELAVLYEAFAAGRPSPLPEPPIQYADYAEWQREHFRGEVLETHLAYWKEQLAGAPRALELPTDRPRPAVQTFGGARQSVAIPKGTVDALKELSAREGVSLFMTLLAAFQTLLHRYTGGPDLVVGTRIAQRDWKETEGLVGFLVNALPLRTDLSGNPRFRELLRRVRETALGAYAHQHLPFEQLVAALQPKRDVSRPAVFQVMFVLQNVLLPTLRLPDLTLEPFQIGAGTAKFDLDFWLVEKEDGTLGGSIEYPTDLFDPATIERILRHFRRVLEKVSADAETRLSDISLLDEEEERQLALWNATGAEYPRDATLGELFEAQVERTPEALAAVFEGERLTYRELNERANRLARHLRRLGVGPEVMVCVCLERSTQTLVSLLAILKAGGVYVPLDPSYPAAHLAFILSDTGAPVVITERRLRSNLPGGAAPAAVVLLDEHRELIAGQGEANPPGAALPDNAAYVMYTSGSTGQPKGVVVHHRQLVNRCAWMWRRYPFAEGEVACQRTTANFSVSMWELLGALLQGTPTVILAEHVVRDVPELARALAEHGVTRIVVVPSLLRLILESDVDLERRLHRLKLWSVCGEALPAGLYREFTRRLPHATLVNQYGASEVNDAAFYDTSRLPPTGPRVPIGRPIDNLKIHILDEGLGRVPVGMPGTLYVESVSLARGYHRRPAMTAERFIPHPFGDLPGARLFNMGDLARRRPDGVIEYLGRRDHQVKVRGVRVELGGVEEVLRRHPSVGQAVVAARADDDGGDCRLVAYVVSAGGQEADVSDLHNYLKERLPLPMLPSSFVVLDALPLTPNGKLDRKALPDPSPSRPALSQHFVAPRTPPERAVADIWAEVLGLRQVGAHDNFFELGGHSLMATQVVSRLRKAFQVELPLRRFFAAPTVAATAEAILEAQFEQAGDGQQLLLALAEQLSDEEVELELRRRLNTN
ncbi:MAG TPA: amino acid adenylation domain-containing protein [Pyrinomonadaceae bacterium]|jgi:amino acid adenylation domain-containing protein